MDTLGLDAEGFRSAFFAIDEGPLHLPSGDNEFRPEYRQLSRLRTKFPDCPIAAFTASANAPCAFTTSSRSALSTARPADKFICPAFTARICVILVRSCSALDQNDLLGRRTTKL